MLRKRMDWALSRHRAFGDGPETLVKVLREGLTNLDAMIRAGLSIQIVWYEDLIADPLSTLRRLEIESDGRGALDPTLLAAALEKDSQAGSNLARSNVKPRQTEENCLRAFDALWEQTEQSEIVQRLNLARLI